MACVKSFFFIQIAFLHRVALGASDAAKRALLRQIHQSALSAAVHGGTAIASWLTA
jgi:hypothetical protein